MRPRSYAAAICAVMVLSGCSTVASRKAEAIKQALIPAVATLRSCLAQAAIGYDDLAKRMPLEGGEPTLIQEADQDHITAPEAQSLISWHASAERCAAETRNVLETTLPPISNVIEEERLSADRIYLALLQRHITWGDAMTQIAALQVEVKKEVYLAAEKVDEQLQAEDAAERAQRAAALAAVGQAMSSAAQAMQQQQLINSLNRPVTTNCTRLFNTVNCTSY